MPVTDPEARGPSRYLQFLPYPLEVLPFLVVWGPPAYGIWLVSSHRPYFGAAVLGAWVGPYAWLLSYAHRKRWARLAFTLPATLLFLAVTISLVL